jgi:hypothetical protein
MKTIKWMLSLVVVAAGMVTALNGCKDDEDPELSIVSIVANGVDLNGATSATGVAVGANIVITFNVDVDPATTSGITLLRQYDNADVPLTITVSGKEVTVNPNTDFGTGTLLILTITKNLKSTAGKSLPTDTERSFTTAGTFAVAGAVAHYTFEDNANDIIGGKNPTASQVVAISYVAGRKADAGKAASFNGTTSIIEISNGDQLMNNGSWTMSLWVKPNSSLGKGQFVLGLGAFYGFQFEISGGYNNFQLAASYAYNNAGTTGKFSEDLWADGTGNLGWQGWTFSKDFGAPTMSPVIKDNWAHYVFVYNATTKQGIVYLNGERIKEQNFNNWPAGDNKTFTTGLSYRGAPPDVVNELALGFIHSRAGTLWDAEDWGGYDKPGANHFHGLMDDLIIYHKALTAGEILTMYNSGKP